MKRIALATFLAAAALGLYCAGRKLPARGPDVVFMDSRVPNLPRLMEGLNPGARVFVLDSERDGVVQIAEQLRVNDLHAISSIQIVSHGAPGQVQLGATVLDRVTLPCHAQELSEIRSSMASGGDLLLYGCRVAEGMDGKLFVAGLAEYTGVDVAASDDPTGAQARGGNWKLEVATGAIQARNPFSDRTLEKFDGLLAITTETFTGANETVFGGTHTYGLFSTTMYRWSNSLSSNGATDGTESLSLASGNTFFVQDFTVYREGNGGNDAKKLRLNGYNASNVLIHTQLVDTTFQTTVLVTVNATVKRLDFVPVQVIANGQHFEGQGALRILVDDLRYDGAPPGNTPPSITGVTSPQVRSFREEGVIVLFDDPAAGILANIQDSDNDTLTVVVSADDPARGMLLSTLTQNGYYFTTLSPGVLQFIGTPPQATEAIRNVFLYFANVDDQVETGGNYTTTFTVTLNDGHNPIVTNTQTQGVIRGCNEKPSITQSAGTLTNQFTYDRDTIAPFQLLTIDDPDNKVVTSPDVPTDTLDVDVTFPDAKGVLAGSGWTKTGVANGDATWRFSGKYQQATTAIQTVLFNPTDGFTPGQVITTSFTVKASDQGDPNDPNVTQQPPKSFTFGSAISVDAKTNTSPVLAGGTISRTAILEDANSAAITVSSLVSSPNAMTDVDTDQRQGIGIVSATGPWQYSTDGANWTNVGTVSASSALVLSNTSQIRLLGSNINGQVSFTYKAWDRSSWLTNAGGTASSFNNRVLVDASGFMTPPANVSPFSLNSVPNNQPITAVNDAPVASGSSTLAAVLEDTADPAGATVNALFSARFDDSADNQAAFGGSSANLLAGVAVTGNAATAAQGAWQYFSGGSWQDVGTRTTATALLVAVGDKLRFLPAANFNGAPGNLSTVLVDDSSGALTSSTIVNLSAVNATGGTTCYSAAIVTLSTSITSVNDAPSGADKTVTANEDTTYTFVAADFGFSDPVDAGSPSGANALLAVKIATLPLAGTFTNNSLPVLANDFITVTDINAGKLKFSPAANANGIGYASFTFQVQDNGGTANGGTNMDASPNSITLDVNPVNDPPAGTNKTVTTFEDAPFPFAAADFGFSDPVEGDSFAAIKVTTLPATGALANNNLSVNAGDFISIADISGGLFTYTPANNANGNGYSSFTFQVRDNGGTSNGGVDLDATPNTITVNVTPVNDAPAGTAHTVSVFENLSYTFQAGDFGFTDPNDSPANTLLAVKIATLPGAGALTLNNAPVNAGDFIAVADLTAGLLKFAPEANVFGNNYASFTFQVQDNGGIANGGADLDPAPKTLSIDVAPVNIPPSGADHTVTADEDVPYAFVAADFGFSDVDGNSLNAVKITSLPLAGTLSNNNLSVSAGDFIAVADLNAGKLKFTPATNANGAAYASFTFQVQDDGGIANGGVDLDQTPNTITADVNAVNDAPVLANVDSNAAYSEGAAPVALDTAALIVVSDVDSANLSQATVTITNGYFADDLLAADVTGTGILLNWDAVSHVLTLTGPDTLANFQQVLRTVTFVSSSDNPTNFGSNPTRTVKWAITDDSIAVLAIPAPTNTTTISITPSNDAPVLDLDGDNSSAAGQNYVGHFVPQAGAVPVADGDTSILDVDDTNIESATVSLTTPQTGDVLSVNGALPGGITVNGASTPSNIILNGSATLASYQTALHQVQFNNPNANPNTSERIVHVVVNDGAVDSNTAVSTLVFNQPPTLGSGPTVSPNPLTLPGTATADVLASDPESEPLTYAWDTAVVPPGGVALFSPSGTSSQSSRTVSFNVEGTYTLRVTVSDGHQSVQGTIDITVLAGVAVTATDSFAWEGGGNPSEFTITRAGSTTGPLSVHYTMSGTAANGTDYTLLSGTATILAGNVSVTVPVTPLQDGATEFKETVILTIATDPAYGIGTLDHALVELFDDEVPLLSIVANGNAAEPSTGTSFTITRQGSLSGLLTVKYTTSGTATYGADYTLTSPPASQVGTALILNGSASVVVNLNVLDDGISEPDETVILTLFPQGAYQIGPANQATVTITDNENHAPQILGTPFATPDPLRMPRRAFVDVSATDQDAGQTLTYTWTKVSGPGTVTFDPAGSQVSSSRMAAFSLPGNYVLRVTVSDGIVNVTGDVPITVLAPPGDADGDGKVDIILRDPVSGDVQLWIMN